MRATRRSVAAMPSARMRRPLAHPPLVWITLWATLRNPAQSLETARPATDCSNFKHMKDVENQ